MKIQTGTLILACVAGGLLLAAYLAGPPLGVPPESHAALVAGIGALGGLALAFVRPLLSRDADGDGIPDVIDPDGGGS